MITISIQSNEAHITVSSKRAADLLGDAAAAVAAFQSLTEKGEQ